MQSVTPTQRYFFDNYQAVRSRLRNPWNAVADRPIRLSRPCGVNGYEAQRLRAERLAEIARKPIIRVAVPMPPIEMKEGMLTALPKARAIQEEVARQWPCSLVDMISARRTREIVVPRHIAIVITKELTLLSLPYIGRVFGGRDHTSILHALRKYEWLASRVRSQIELNADLTEWVRLYRHEFLVGRPIPEPAA